MADCIDAQIFDLLENHLRTELTIANGYNTEPAKVELSRSVRKFDVYPFLEIIPDEIDNESEGLMSSDDNLTFTLFYSDGKNDLDLTVDPLPKRMRNVRADFQKCLYKDGFSWANGLIQNIKIGASACTVDIDPITENIEAGFACMVTITRTIDITDPYV